MTNEQLQHLQTLIRRLVTAAATASLYDIDHPQVDFLVHQALEEFPLALGDENEISLLLIEQDLICGNLPLVSDAAVARLMEKMLQRGLGHIKLRRNLPRSEFLGLVSILTKKGRQEELRSTDHVRFGRVEIKNEAEREQEIAPTKKRKISSLAELEKEEMERFMELFQNVRAGKRINVRGLKEIVGSVVQILSEQSDPLLALAPLRNLDEYTFTHSTNVSILNIVQARLLGISGQLLYDIGLAALLHDIGKLFVPLEVLHKPGKLSDREWRLIQDHPRLGAEYLANTPGVPRLAIITAFEHHMRFDGSGYPNGGKNWQQHLCSQMTTISDFFDALRTHRSYRVAMDFEKTAKIMREESGTALHPQLAINFLKALRKLDHSNPHPPRDSSPLT